MFNKCSYVALNVFKRCLANAATKEQFYFHKDVMRGWSASSLNGWEQLQFLDSISMPLISNHKDVIVKVQATSVNPIDVAMVGGYGNVLLNAMRQCDSLINCSNESLSSPLIPGRDFAGEVIAKGPSVRSNIKVGDVVYGVIPAHQQGCHAEMVVANDSLIRHVPEGVSLEQAAAFLYCGLTAWSALCITGDLFWSNKIGKKALVIGGAGGVGSLAVQLLKHWGLETVATCRPDAIPILECLGVDNIIDYTAADAMRNIEQSGKYDVILDAAGSVTHYTYIPFLKDWCNSKYITLRSPLLLNTDQFGLFAGMVKNAADLVRTNIISGAPKRGATLRWGYFLPIESGVNELHTMFVNSKIKPIVNEVFPFNELPKAYEKVKEGHNRGKIVLLMDDIKSETPKI